MVLRPLTDGKISGTGTVSLNYGRLLGGVLVSTDGTNAAAVTVRKVNASGERVFDISTKTPGFFCLSPIDAGAQTLYYSITGTGASAQLYEAVC